jgi:hypothetical protein
LEAAIAPANPASWLAACGLGAERRLPAKDICLDDVDRQDFLKALAEACRKTGFQLRA